MLNKGSIFIGLFLILLIQANVHLAAQDADTPVLIDATLLTISGDSIQGKVLYTNPYNLQFKISLTDTSGNIINHFTPKELMGFIYILYDDSFEFISIDNPLGVGKVFLQLVYQSKLSVFQFLELDPKSTYYSFNTYYYLWNSKWLEPPITHEFEKQSLLYHFASFPELEYKIKTGEYGFPQIRKILDEYEDCNLTDDYEYFYE